MVLLTVVLVALVLLVLLALALVLWVAARVVWYVLGVFSSPYLLGPPPVSRFRPARARRY